MSEISSGADTSDLAQAPADEWVLAGPWSRYWARTFDIILLGTVIDTALWFAWPEAFADESPLHEMGGFSWIILSLPIIMVLDAVVQALFGVTPGKAIFGIRVQFVLGDRLSMWQCLRRNLDVYISGMAAGIPLVNFATHLHCYKVLDSGRLTRWDKNLGTRVVSRGYSAWTKLLLIGIAIGLYAAFAAWWGVTLPGL